MLLKIPNTLPGRMLSGKQKFKMSKNQIPARRWLVRHRSKQIGMNERLKLFVVGLEVHLQL